MKTSSISGLFRLTRRSRRNARGRRWGRNATAAVLLVPAVVVGGTVLASPASAVPGCWVGPAVVRGNAWYVNNFGYRNATSIVAGQGFSYGRAGDEPFFGHWDAASVQSAPGVVRGATWYLRRTRTSGPANITFTYGRPGDIHVVGDWNGDGIDTPGVVRGNTWYLRNSNTSGPADVTFTFNATGTPTVYYLFGQPTAVATFNAGTWSVRTEQTTGGADFTINYGQAGDTPLGGGLYVAAPDCTSPSVAVVRGNAWHIDGNGSPDTTFTFGRATDHFLAQHY
jgi:hypothetical protein